MARVEVKEKISSKCCLLGLRLVIMIVVYLVSVVVVVVAAAAVVVRVVASASDVAMVSSARKCQVAEISQSAFLHCAPRLSII